VTSRRAFLGAAGLAAAQAQLPAARGDDLLPIPRLNGARVVRCVAGVRPFRAGGVRLERERLGDKTIVHNYGHGGAGVTLSWGSAEEVADLLPPGTRTVAVAGAGVMGLTTAYVLQERGIRVRIYARERSPHTTSDLAGAEWSPDIVDPGDTPEARARFSRVVRRSWQRFVQLIGPRWGVWQRPSYQADGVGSGLAVLPPGLIPAAEPIARLPFPGAAHSALAYRTLLIEPPRFLPALARAIGAQGGTFVTRTFPDVAGLGALPEPVIVNCLGLGAGKVVADAAVRPIKGQLVHLAPQALPYLLDHREGYVFARSDVLILGGSFEEGRADTRVDPAVCARILAAARRFFA
jgi:D-amino-acid oxidase